MISNTVLIITVVVGLGSFVPNLCDASGEWCLEGPLSAFENSDVVFCGYATEKCISLTGSEEWSFEAVAVWKGEVEKIVQASPGVGAILLELGGFYLVYADSAKGGLVFDCRTYPFACALVDRYKLQKPLRMLADSEIQRVSLEDIAQSITEPNKECRSDHSDCRWLKSEADALVPHLVSVVNSEHPGDSEAAARALGYLGVGAHAAVPDLERVAEEGDERLVRAAQWALVRIFEDREAQINKRGAK
jgi:hypothetical protein